MAFKIICKPLSVKPLLPNYMEKWIKTFNYKIKSAKLEAPLLNRPNTIPVLPSPIF